MTTSGISIVLCTSSEDVSFNLVPIQYWFKWSSLLHHKMFVQFFCLFKIGFKRSSVLFLLSGNSSWLFSNDTDVRWSMRRKNSSYSGGRVLVFCSCRIVSGFQVAAYIAFFFVVIVCRYNLRSISSSATAVIKVNNLYFKLHIFQNLHMVMETSVYSPSLLICKGASGWKSGERLAYRYHAFKSRSANCSWCTEYSNEVLAITCYCLLQVTLWMGNTSDRKQEWVILPPPKEKSASFFVALSPNNISLVLQKIRWKGSVFGFPHGGNLDERSICTVSSLLVWSQGQEDVRKKKHLPNLS